MTEIKLWPWAPKPAYSARSNWGLWAGPEGYAAPTVKWDRAPDPPGYRFLPLPPPALLDFDRLFIESVLACLAHKP